MASQQLILQSSETIDLVQFQSTTAIRISREVDHDSMSARLIAHCEVSGMSLCMFSMLQMLSEQVLTSEEVLAEVGWQSDRRWMELPYGNFVDFPPISAKNAEESLQSMFDQQLLAVGIPNISERDSVCWDFWNEERVCFSAESVILTEKGRALWLQLERNVLQCCVIVNRVIGATSVFVSNWPLLVSGRCQVVRMYCEVQCPFEACVNRDDEGNDSLGACALGTVPNWRSHWWREPQFAYVLRCERDPSLIEWPT